MSKKFRVRSVEFRVHEDSWKDGEGKLISIWADGNFAAHGTIEAALAEIPYFEESTKVWKNDPCKDGEYARFDADKTIDWDFDYNDPEMNVSNEKLEAWKSGKIMLYAMHARAYVEAISDLTADDVKDFGNS